MLPFWLSLAPCQAFFLLPFEPNTTLRTFAETQNCLNVNRAKLNSE